MAEETREVDSQEIGAEFQSAATTAGEELNAMFQATAERQE